MREPSSTLTFRAFTTTGSSTRRTTCWNGASRLWKRGPERCSSVRRGGRQHVSVTCSGRTTSSPRRSSTGPPTRLRARVAAPGDRGTLCRDDRPECIEPLIDDATKAVFCESVGNPALNVVDLEAVARSHTVTACRSSSTTRSRRHYLKPIQHGADVVVHSLTKFFGGHGTTLGGAIVDAGRSHGRITRR